MYSMPYNARLWPTRIREEKQRVQPHAWNSLLISAVRRDPSWNGDSSQRLGRSVCPSWHPLLSRSAPSDGQHERPSAQACVAGLGVAGARRVGSEQQSAVCTPPPTYYRAASPKLASHAPANIASGRLAIAEADNASAVLREATAAVPPSHVKKL